MTGRCLKEILSQSIAALGDEPLILVDEFDSLLLTLDDLSMSLVQLLPQNATIVGMSGSELQPYHLQFLEGKLAGTHINFNKKVG